MKIAFVNARYAPNEFGGAERTVRTLAEALVERGHDVCSISLSHTGEASQGELNGVRTYYVPLYNLFTPGEKKRNFVARGLWHVIDAYNPIMGRRVGRILDKERPELLHTSNLIGFSVAVWQAAKRRNIPVVQMLHDYYLGCPNSAMFRDGKNCTRQCRSCRVYSLPRRATSNIPTAVISLSDRVLEKLEECGLFSEIEKKAVIHGISSLRVAAPEREGRDAGRPLVVGYLGRIEPTKGVEVLLDAVQQASGVRLLLGGSGAPAYIDALKMRQPSERVEFVGYVRPDEFFRRVDLLVVPSIWEEPLGRVIYEAYAYGLPVIVARAGGMPEIVEHGRTGFVVSPNDPVELAELLNRLSQDWSGQPYFDACIAKSKEFRTEQRFAQYYDVWAGAVLSAAE